MPDPTPLLLECLHPAPDAARLSALAPGADWDALLPVASASGLAPLLYARLSAACPNSVPPAALETLRGAFLRNTRRNIMLAAELLDVLDALAAAGLPALPFKGPALAWSIYDSPGLREFSDLDLLVHRKDFVAARRVLAALGYTPSDGHVPTAFLDYNNELPLHHAQRRIQIDLHWHPTGAFHGLVEPEFFWSSLAQVEIGGRAVETFSAERTFVYLCLHGGGHGWHSLKWLSDLAHLAASHALDWQRLLREARSRRITRHVLLGMALAEDLLGTECPAPVPLRTMKSRRVFAQARGHLLNGWPGQGRFREMLFQWPLLERGRDKFQLLWTMLQPTPADLGAVRLPPSCFGFYYGVRAARLVCSTAAGFLSHSVSN